MNGRKRTEIKSEPYRNKKMKYKKYKNHHFSAFKCCLIGMV